ncbi:hypothetical protein [Pedobacter montanisoli]|uniref:Uncharacterized protein n=1 Tax=Pedobacter montanisoli TaxID=2923277 RepID=A0ABS9ZZ29_9SPHI|nr:hypothetical protein [Pedobacter montanisoli]MCJ0743576.1 hypothetical protein [Pedobacter montanisoli]
MTKILITAATTATAIKIKKAFAGFELILADYGEVPQLQTENYSFLSLGNQNKESAAHILLTSCLDHNVDMILPLYRFEIEAVSKAVTLFTEYGIKVLLPRTDLLPQYDVQTDLKNWIILENGNILYQSFPEHIRNEEAANLKLNGAFYIEPQTEKLGLISI